MSKRDADYQDFSLRCERADAQGRRRVVAESGQGEDSECFDSGIEVRRLLAPFEQMAEARAAKARAARARAAGDEPALEEQRNARTASSEHQLPTAEELGDLLYKTFLRGRLGELFERTLGTTQGTGTELRLKLRLALEEDPGAAVLSNLPWELLYRSKSHDFIGLNRMSPVVRYLDLPRPVWAAPFSPPLRILVIAANPTGSATLDLGQERDAIEDAWRRNGGATIDVLEQASADTLAEKLSGRPYHALHFMGHGDLDPTTGEGCLLLEGPGGHPEQLSATVLANQLKARLPLLVVINACSSGRVGVGAGQDAFAGVATALVMAGVPAVVAMRVPVSDRAAVAFSRRLYLELAAGWAVDAAVAEARLEIYRRNPKSLEWATPVLFMRVPDGKLFEKKKRRGPEEGPEQDPETSKPGARAPEATAPAGDVTSIKVKKHIGNFEFARKIVHKTTAPHDE